MKRKLHRKTAATITSLAMLAAAGTSAGAFSPRGAQTEHESDIEYKQSKGFAEYIGNYKIVPPRLLSQDDMLGDSPDKPTESWNIPTTGNVNILVLPVNFPSSTNSSRSITDISNLMFGNENTGSEDYPYESLSAYYKRSSYGKLNINGQVMDWYTAAHPASYYETAAADEFLLSSDEELTEEHRLYSQQARARSLLVKEALNACVEKGVDLSVYDNNNDGIIDCVYILWDHDDGGDFWWACQDWYEPFGADEFDGLLCNAFVWASIEPSDKNANPRGAATWIHEFGHILGLPDYYDADWDIWWNDGRKNENLLKEPHGGTGSIGMMDRSIGDFDAFSKYMFGWLEPIILTGGTRQINLRPLSVYPDAVLIKPEFTGSLADEYYMVEYRHESGNDQNLYNDVDDRNNGEHDKNTYESPGITIWHIHSELESGQLKYDNTENNSNIKFIDRVVADGTDHINQKARAQKSGEDEVWYAVDFWTIGDWSAGSNDFYVPGKSFTPESNPGSAFSGGKYSGISITNFTETSNGMTATYTVDAPLITSVYYDSYADRFVVELDSNIASSDFRKIKLYYGDELLEKTCDVSGNKLYITPTSPVVRGAAYEPEIEVGALKNTSGLGNSIYKQTVFAPGNYICDSIGFYKDLFNPITSIPAGATQLYVEGTVLSRNTINTKAKIALATYDKTTGVLKDIKTYTSTLTAGDETSIIQPFTINSSDRGKVYYKAFLWENNTMQAITDCIGIE